MDIGSEAVLLRIFIGEDDVFAHEPLVDAIVTKAQAEELAGATVLRGRQGFGPSSRTPAITLSRSEDRPLVIEIVDVPEKINRFVPVVAAMMGGGMITLQPVTVLRYGAAPPPS
jgi:uncharacterized protein